MTGSVAVFPSQQFLDTNGQPVANGTLTVYQANTLTLAQTWTDKDQTTLNTNPIILDALGEPPDSIWLLPGSFYDVVLKDQLGATVRAYNDVTGANSVPQTSSGEWVQFGGALTYVDPNTFTTPGNQTSSFQRGRKILCYISPGLTVQGTIIAAVFTTVTTVTVRFPNVATVLNAGLNRVDLSLITPLLSPIWSGDNINIDMTGYAGGDVQTQPGAMYTYTLAASTTLPLRLATGDNQLYELRILPTNIAGATHGACFLQPNNANTGAGAVGRSAMFVLGGAAPVANGIFLAENNFVLDGGNTPYKIHVEICTKTNGKSIESQASNLNATGANSITTTHGRWSDTVTAWSSLGTLNFGAALTGLVVVKRLL